MVNSTKRLLNLWSPKTYNPSKKSAQLGQLQKPLWETNAPPQNEDGNLKSKKSDPRDLRFTDPEKTWVSNNSIATYWTGSVGIRSHSIFDA